MLTRLKVNGFKNLVNVDIRFGPFTCIAGVNGVGKSNLFDAISFLSALAEKPLLEAAMSVRDDGSHSGDLRGIFHHVGEYFARKMEFEAEMIVPQSGEDDLGQPAKAAITFLRYRILLGLREEDRVPAGGIEILAEELIHIRKGDARDHLPFSHTLAWRNSAIVGRRSGTGFISTENGQIKVHQDGGSTGRPRTLLAKTLPRTALSVANAAESQTALLAKREMQSWRRLQLEPSQLRKPNSFNTATMLTADGSNLAANLFELAKQAERDPSETDGSGKIYAEIANSLSNLIDDVREVGIDVDEKRELYTLVVTGRDHTGHTARSLSDGTLRFLALEVLQKDPRVQGVLCLEEPENGIHPARIPAMLQLLKEMSVAVDEPISLANPLRQIIINTHSPAVVAQAPDDSVLMAEPISMSDRSGERYVSLVFRPLPGTWRANLKTANPVPLGNILTYLDPMKPSLPSLPEGMDLQRVPLRRENRVIDRKDVQGRLFGVE